MSPEQGFLTPRGNERLVILAAGLGCDYDHIEYRGRFFSVNYAPG